MATEGHSIYGVLGFPAGHSLSPSMHRAAFDRLGMDAEYRAFEVRAEQLEYFLKVTARRDLRGFNITIPYKEQSLPFLDYVSPEARLIGAVNTVKVHSARLEGFNTDGKGFIADLAEKGFDPKGAIVRVLGAGGASRAVCFSLAAEGAREVAVYNRDPRKADRLVGDLKTRFPDTVFRTADSVSALDMSGAGLLVNATSVGMKETDPELVEVRDLHKGLFVYDLIYSPPETKLLKKAAAAGCRTANGLGMLLHQGMLAFEIWTGVKPPRGVMEQALRKTLCG